MLLPLLQRGRRDDHQGWIYPHRRHRLSGLGSDCKYEFRASQGNMDGAGDYAITVTFPGMPTYTATVTVACAGTTHHLASLWSPAATLQLSDSIHGMCTLNYMGVHIDGFNGDIIYSWEGTKSSTFIYGFAPCDAYGSFCTVTADITYFIQCTNRPDPSGQIPRIQMQVSVPMCISSPGGTLFAHGVIGPGAGCGMGSGEGDPRPRRGQCRRRPGRRHLRLQLSDLVRTVRLLVRRGRCRRLRLCTQLHSKVWNVPSPTIGTFMTAITVTE